MLTNSHVVSSCRGVVSVGPLERQFSASTGELLSHCVSLRDVLKVKGLSACWSPGRSNFDLSFKMWTYVQRISHGTAGICQPHGDEVRHHPETRLLVGKHRNWPLFVGGFGAGTATYFSRSSQCTCATNRNPRVSHNSGSLLGLQANVCVLRRVRLTFSCGLHSLGCFARCLFAGLHSSGCSHGLFVFCRKPTRRFSAACHGVGFPLICHG